MTRCRSWQPTFQLSDLAAVAAEAGYELSKSDRHSARKYDFDRLVGALALPPPVESQRSGLWTLGQRSWIDLPDDEENGCWLWAGPLLKDGYAQTTNGGSAHRIAYRYWVGDIPEDHHVDHVCHNVDLTCTDGSTCQHRRCVRPDHLASRPALENLGDQYTARKTHCVHGHEYTPENTAYRGGWRYCRTCNRISCGGSEHPRLRSGRLVRPAIFEGRREDAARERQYDAETGLRVELEAQDDSVREVPLKGGITALIDADDWPLVSTYQWYPRVDSGHWMYARGIRRVDGKTEWVVMHRVVMQPARGQRVYHRNRNALDNRRANLQLGPLPAAG